MCVGYIFLRITTLQSSVTAGLLAGLLEAVKHYHHEDISHVENYQCIDAIQQVATVEPPNKDTLGAELLSSFRRLSFGGRFKPICTF